MQLMSKRKPTNKSDKRVRNVVYVSLDDVTETALQSFISAQRIAPERSSIGLTALIEFLTREGYLPLKK